MTNTIVRTATLADLAEVLDLYLHLHPDEQLEAATAERVWSTLLTSDFMTVIVAQAGERLISSCTLAIIPNLTRGGRSYGVIENVVTHADYRRQGLGGRVWRMQSMSSGRPIAIRSSWRRTQSWKPSTEIRIDQYAD